MKWPFFAVWPLGHVQQIKANEVSLGGGRVWPSPRSGGMGTPESSTYLCIDFYRLDDSLWGAVDVGKVERWSTFSSYLFQR